MVSKKATTSCLCALMAALAGSAFAAGPVKEEAITRYARVQRISPVSITYQGHTYPVQPGGHTDDAVVVFENGTTQTLGLFGTGSLPRQHVMDQCNFTPGPGAGSPVLITSMVIAVGTVEIVAQPLQNLEMEVHLWNTVTLANTPVNTNEAGAGIRLNFVPPAGGWAINTAYVSNPVDLTTLPGGGLPTTNGDIGVEQSFFVPGGVVPTGYNTDFSGVMWSNPASTGPTVGTADPALYWRDANGNGIISTDEARTFGTAADANFVMSFTGTVGGGPPSCYANCDASTADPILNANDFQCFLNKYAANDSFANCDESTADPVLNANDFQCFLNKYAAGCS